MHTSSDAVVLQSLNIYRYLDDESYIEAWTKGGKIPIRQALYYRELESGSGRSDAEDAVQRTVKGMSIQQMRGPMSGPPLIEIEAGANISLNINNSYFGNKSGGFHIKSGRFTQSHPPCLILCLSTELNLDTAKAIDEKCKFCVRILDIQNLKSVIDAQLGANGKGGRVEYTSGDDRGTFLKSEVYRPQNEYRLAWEGAVETNVWVNLPPGVAEQAEIPR